MSRPVSSPTRLQKLVNHLELAPPGELFPVAIPAHGQVNEPLQTLFPRFTPLKAVPVKLSVMTFSWYPVSVSTLSPKPKLPRTVLS